MPTTPALSAAKMRRNLGLTTVKLAENSVTTDKIQQLADNRFLGRTSSGTGNPEQINQFLHMRVPGWTDGSYVTNRSSLSAYLDGVARSNQNCPCEQVQVSFINSSFFGSSNLAGGVLHPNGKIYGFSDVINNVVVIDPINNTVSTFHNFNNGAETGDKYEGGCVHPNGKIYMMPNCWSYVAVVDPSNNTVSSIGGVPGVLYTGVFASSIEAYSSACVGPNGKIYMQPQAATFFTCLDPSNNTFQVFATWTGSYPAGSGDPMPGPDGFVYYGKYRVDPSNNSWSTWFPNVWPYSGGRSAFAPNGKIIVAPSSTGESFCYAIDPSNNSVQTFGTFIGATSDYGLKLLPNGKLLAGIGEGTLVHVIDPDNLTVTRIATITTLVQKYNSLVVTRDGNAYFISRDATNSAVLRFVYNNTWNNNVATNPMVQGPNY